MESIDDSLKSICRRVKKSLKLLHGVDTCKPVDGGINESGFKALFQGALAEDNYHVESEFKLGGQYCDLLLTRRDAPFDVAIVLDLKYCATPFIASKHFDNAAHDSKQLEALKKLNVLDICKLKMFWSKGYEAVSVKTVLVAAKKQTNAFAESLLATGMFPFVLSVTVVGIGPCLVTKIETLGRVRPLLVPSPQTLFPHAHSDLHRLQHRVRQAMATLRSTDGDIDLKHGYKSGITLTGLKLIFLGALHDSSFFVGSAVNMQPASKKERERRGRDRKRIRESRSSSRSSSGSRSSRSRSSSSSSSSSSRSRSDSRDRRRRRSSKKKSHRRSRSDSGSRSGSGSRSTSRSSSTSSSSSRTTAITRDGVTYNVKNESLGTIHLLLFNDRSKPTHAVVVHFKYFPVNDVHEYNPATKTFDRFGDQSFENDKLKHKRRLYLSEGLRRLSGLTREELERVYVKNPATGGERVDTVGTIARAYTSLAFRQSQAVLEKFSTLKTCTSVSIIGVGSTLLWLQEEVSPTPFNMDSIKQSLLSDLQGPQVDLEALRRKFKRKKGQSEAEYQQALKAYARKEQEKLRQQLAHVRARSVDHRSSGHHGRSAKEELLARAGRGQGDVIALLAQRYEERQARSGSLSPKRRSGSQGRGNLNSSSYF
jgi:hypothetical protein